MIDQGWAKRWVRQYNMSVTGCSSNIVFFSKDFRIFRTLVFLCFPSVSVCVHTHRSNPSACSRTGRVQKNHNILRKNTIFNEHPVLYRSCFSSKKDLMANKGTFNQNSWFISFPHCQMKYGIVEAVTTVPLFLAYPGELGTMQYWSENHQVRQ